MVRTNDLSIVKPSGGEEAQLPAIVVVPIPHSTSATRAELKIGVCIEQCSTFAIQTRDLQIR